MHDNPDRIAPLLRSLRLAWEKYPDLTFVRLVTTLEGQAANPGQRIQDVSDSQIYDAITREIDSWRVT